MSAKISSHTLQRALMLSPGDPSLHLQYGRHLISTGQGREALDVAVHVATMPLQRADWNDALGTLFTYCDEPIRAIPFFERAINLAPNDSRYLYNLATAQRMIGDLVAAEATLDRVIADRPSHAFAHYTRADLRTQTEADNHINEMLGVLETRVNNASDEILMCFAIAKELDDLADYKTAFQYLKRGCDLKRKTFTYNINDDISTIDRIIQLHDSSSVDKSTGLKARGIIFVMGLPRTGTTLVEHILSSHASVHGAGELQAFPVETIKAVRQLAGRSVSKHEFVDLALKVDGAELGQSYLNAVRPQAAHAPFFVDKQPMNYLYAGLIRRALPNSRIVALARDPIDACFAMYRTLFTGAYPFSYDLSELAAYYAAWYRLTHHWQSTLGENLLVLKYEDLVTDLEPVSRRLLTHCGLTWDEACLAFERQARAVTTASAVQVRRPLYSSSVGKWRNYGEQLAPLLDSLRQLEPPGGWLFA
jgi:tetratricopeptide (TPR) repeat protein